MKILKKGKLNIVVFIKVNISKKKILNVRVEIVEFIFCVILIVIIILLNCFV